MIIHRFLPEYYTDPEFPEFQKLTPEEQSQLQADILSYRQAVSDATDKAKAEFIDKWVDHPQCGILYSKTWGK